MSKISNLLLTTTAMLALVSSGCKTAAPQPSGFLSTYKNLRQVNNSTWRYVDASRLSAYRTFTLAPVSVVVKEYWGSKFTADQKEAVAARFRRDVVNALSSRYSVVGAPGPNTAEVRVAITEAYRVGNSLALGVEAEIVDTQTHEQLAALRGVRIGPPEMGFRLGYHNPDAAGYMEAWWSWPGAVQLMDEWAQEIRNLVDEAHKR